MLSLRCYIICLFSVGIFQAARTTTLSSAGSGLWHNSASWSPVKVPACGDSMIIQANHTITINNLQDYTSCGTPLIIVIYGNLNFGNGDKLKLPCGSKIYVFPSGSITGAGGGGSSNTIDVCGTTFWNASNGNLTGPACVPSTLPGCSTVLPILLGRFEATQCAAGVCLHWQTLAERYNLFFKVERLFDERDWEEIGQVDSRAEGGTSVQPLDYYFEDRAPLRAVNYYRLRQFDKNGQVNVHGIVMAERRDRSVSIQLYPNPGRGQFHVQFPGIQVPGTGMFELTDIYGAVIRGESFELKRDIFTLDLPGMASGVYFLVLTIDQFAERVKLLID